MKNKSLILAAACCLLILGYSCNRQDEITYERGLTPWVFRSVLDEQARMLTAALHEDLFVAYSAETGALYKAWKGDVALDGAVYTTAHGPQPESVGKGWMKNPYAQPWFLDVGGEHYPEEEPELRYLGHRIRNGQLYVSTEVKFPGMKVSVVITERPEYVTGKDGQVGLERTFTATNLPSGVRMGLRVKTDGLPFAGSLQTDGEWRLKESVENKTGNLSSVTVTGELLLKPSGETTLTTFFVRTPTLPDDNQKEGAALADNREPGEILIERSGCKTCHNTRVKTVGPAYVAVAERYANTTANVDKLTKKVISGGAGQWGQAAMTAHDHLPPSDVRTMVRWVMDLDKGTEVVEEEDGKAFELNGSTAVAAAGITDDGLGAGVRIEIYDLPGEMGGLASIDWDAAPRAEGVAPWINYEGAEWGKLEDNFAARFSGYLKIPETSNYLFRLKSDDGSRLVIDGQEIINHDGYHGPSPKDGELALAKGNHSFFVEYFEAGGGQAVILEWRSFFNPEWTVVPTENLGYDLSETTASKLPAPMDRGDIYPGDGTRLAGVHPSYTLTQARPNGFAPKVGGMDFLSDGRLVISTWDAEGAVYILDGVQTGDPARITTKKIATGLAEPLGLKVVDDVIYIMQKQELTKLIDHDGDEIIDEYATVSNDWLTTANFHEFGFGLAYRKPYFYASLAIGILPGGASAKNQPASRGKAVRIHEETGELEYIASGLRTPNGVNFGVDGELFIADNQGDWLPASKILHVTEGAFFNSYAVETNETKTPKPPVVWLPQDEIGNSPSTPNILNDGPYAGQMIHGEITHGGFKRVFVERVNGQYQGTVFRFIQGLEAGVNRNVWGPDGALYVGMIGSTGNWGDAGKLHYGLQRLKYNGAAAFEMLAVRTQPDGLEIEFTQPVKEGLGADAAGITLRRWWYKPTADYGGPKLDETDLNISGMSWSADRKKLRLTFGDLSPNHVYYLRLPKTWTDHEDRPIWTTEAWTTVNNVPEKATK